MYKRQDPGVPTACNITVIVVLPFATLDCARDVMSHICQPFVGTTSIVERVISFAEQLGALFHVTLLSSNVSHA